MAQITNSISVCNKPKVTIPLGNFTPLATEVFHRLGMGERTPMDMFIDAMREEKHDVILYRDDENDFMAYTKFGSVYCYYDGQFYVVFYPKPSLIPLIRIQELIDEEVGFHNYDNVAELYHFLSLSDKEKDEYGFPFYSWLWEEGKWDNMAKYYNFYTLSEGGALTPQDKMQKIKELHAQISSRSK